MLIVSTLCKCIETMNLHTSFQIADIKCRVDKVEYSKDKKYINEFVYIFYQYFIQFTLESLEWAKIIHYEK